MWFRVALASMAMLKIERLFAFFTLRKPKPKEPPLLPQAWVWTEYKAALPQADFELTDSHRRPVPMAWVWRHYRGEMPQTAEEKQLLALPKPTAWVWAHYKASLPQTAAEREELTRPPTPMAWVWSQYRGALPQSEDEKQMAAMLARRNDNVVMLRQRAPIFPNELAASIAVGFTGLILLLQAAVLNGL